MGSWRNFSWVSVVFCQACWEPRPYNRMVLWRGKTKPVKRWPVSCKMVRELLTSSG
ncbi:hypothetical protein V6Z12_A03G096700 [Gossypium hirsutum]